MMRSLKAVVLIVLAVGILSCRAETVFVTATPAPTPSVADAPTLYPTYTPYPTSAASPTYKPAPTSTSAPTPTAAPTPTSAPTPIPTSECVSSFRQAHSIETLMAETDVVFIGIPTGATEEIRVGGPDIFGIGTLREYRVERYLDGDGPDLVNVLQYFHTREYHVDGASRSCVRSSATDYAPPVNGERYLLYLKTDPKLPNVFFAFYEPSRFTLKNGSVIPDSPWELATRAFPPDVEETVLSKIAAVRND